LTYGGNGWLTGLLGIGELMWVVSFILLGIEMVVFPMVIATSSDKYYAAKYAGAAGKPQASIDWFVLGNQMLVAFASWTAAVALQKSTSRLINFFDIYNTDQQAVYNAAFGKNPTWDNNTGMIVDFVNHSTVVGFYYILAATIANGAYFWGNTSITAATNK
jgi:hypothetical protein